ncbi:hypothetical protein Pint_22973 [Pistacia integerrima]|uniref:Uncharacterized protein n=1 Tax=Pistacia integerrima TaxID=434235 RepID=A0ACC0YN43_9ROSI|nr:hypothetical protein Pint_22973 [Pistacia integerrima]
MVEELMLGFENEFPEFEKATEKDDEYLKGDNLREASKEQLLVKPRQIREELVQMAVKFLSHATVRSSPVLSRHSFLENKGLTKEEIDEAFLRVPLSLFYWMQITGYTFRCCDWTESYLKSSYEVKCLNVVCQNVHLKSFTNSQPQATALATSPPAQFYWSHAFGVMGLLFASGAGAAILLKSFIFPRLKSWIRKVVLDQHDGSSKKSKPSLFEEVISAAMTASTAAADAAKASMEMFNSKNKERQYFEALKKRIDIQVAELRSMNNTIQKLEGTRGAAPSSYKQQQKYLPYTSRNGGMLYCLMTHHYNAPQKSPNVKANGVSNFGCSVIPSSAPASMRSSVGQHPKSYPSLHIFYYSYPSTPLLTIKPVILQILSMIQRGEIPPGIKEINDSPPNPDQPLPNPGMSQRIKPWDVAQPSNKGTYEQDLGSTSELKCDRVLPWWHKNNVRTETEPRNGMTTSMFDVPNDGWSIQSSVPSQPFCVTMPRAVS